MPVKMTGEAAKKSGLSSQLEIETEGREAALSLSAQQGDGTVAILAAKAGRSGGRWPFEQWAGQVEEDCRAGRYDRGELRAYVQEARGITVAPWRLAVDVRAFLAARKAAEFRERLRVIRVEGLSDARAEGDKRRWRVRFADETVPVVILEEVLPEPARPTLESLEREWGEWKFDRQAAGARRLEERIEAIRAGRPDPHPEPRGEPEKRELRTPGDLRGWTFRPYQPRLF